MNAEGGGKRILVVDDDANIRRFVAESLRLRGYEVDSFEAAEPALEKLTAVDYDLALLDIHLPGINGLQLCHKIRQHPETKDLPVVMMTAFYKQADHIRDAREQYGATDYLLKPFPLKTLHEKIVALIGESTHADTKARLKIEGLFTETPFPEILHNLYSLKATGLLHLERGNIKKVIYIRKGYPIFVRSNMVREFLGQILVRTEIISESDLKKSLALSKERNQRHGSTMIEMGLISEEQLNETLHDQVTNKLLEIFSWPDGRYRFIQARAFKPGVTNIDLSPANLILRGLREHSTREQLHKLLQPYLNLYLSPAENPIYLFQEIKLSDIDNKMFDKCQGKLTLKQLLERFHLSRRDAEPLFATLLSTGILVGRKEGLKDSEEFSRQVQSNVQAKHEVFLKDYSWMMEQDYFTLLGVNENSSRDQIRKSYFSLVKKYHPDQSFEQELPPELVEKVDTLFQRINEAHETLTDAVARSRYLNKIKGDNKKSPDPKKLLQAEGVFQKGLLLLEVKKYREALELFSLALEINPDDAKYLMNQAWATFKCAPHDRLRRENAQKKLQRVIQLDPKLSLAYLYLGHIHKENGETKEAIKKFERATHYDRNCTEALRELRLINMRTETGRQQKKGLLGKMFNK